MNARSQATALVLSGGGARGAYQVGVLRGIFEITQSLSISDPFQILTGVSAGAINTAYLAAYADHFEAATQRLCAFWGGIHSEQIYRTDIRSIGQIGIHWAFDALSGGYRLGQQARALLDTTPLAGMLAERIPFPNIAENVQRRILSGVAVSATNYATSECISFYMANATLSPWRRSRRIGREQLISTSEVMASAAIPIFFPPINIGREFFGDGCLRNTAPLSPALHLGADRLLIIGVRKAAPETTTASEIIESPLDATDHEPSIARILNVLINAVLLDGVDADIERLSRINRTVGLLAPEARAKTPLRKIDWLYIHPSEDVAKIAMDEMLSMPRLIRYLIAGLGSAVEAADLISYLLFEPSFCCRLLDLGYKDAMAQEKAIVEFFTSSQEGRNQPI